MNTRSATLSRNLAAAGVAATLVCLTVAAAAPASAAEETASLSSGFTVIAPGHVADAAGTGLCEITGTGLPAGGHEVAPVRDGAKLYPHDFDRDGTNVLEYSDGPEGMVISATGFGDYVPSAVAPLVIHVPSGTDHVSRIVLQSIDPTLDLGSIASHVLIDLSAVTGPVVLDACDTTLQDVVPPAEDPIVTPPPQDPTVTPPPQDPIVTPKVVTPSTDPVTVPVTVPDTVPVPVPGTSAPQIASGGASASLPPQALAPQAAAETPTTLAITGGAVSPLIPLIAVAAIVVGAVVLGRSPRRPRAGARRATIE